MAIMVRKCKRCSTFDASTIGKDGPTDTVLWTEKREICPASSYRIDCRIHNSNNGINGETWTMLLRTCHNYWETTVASLVARNQRGFACLNDKNPFAKAIRFWAKRALRVYNPAQRHCRRGDFMWKEIRSKHARVHEVVLGPHSRLSFDGCDSKWFGNVSPAAKNRYSKRVKLLCLVTCVCLWWNVAVVAVRREILSITSSFAPKSCICSPF